jgi:hypothetical protein
MTAAPLRTSTQSVWQTIRALRKGSMPRHTCWAQIARPSTQRGPHLLPAPRPPRLHASLPTDPFVCVSQLQSSRRSSADCRRLHRRRMLTVPARPSLSLACRVEALDDTVHVQQACGGKCDLCYERPPLTQKVMLLSRAPRLGLSAADSGVLWQSPG